MPEMTRAEHMKWCKERAWNEFNFYKKKENLKEAIQAGVGSMLSDLRKHPETAGLLTLAGMLALTVRDERGFKEFVNGFAE